MESPKAESGTKILVLTIIAAFFSVFVGGCTAAAGKGLSDFNRKFSNGADSERLERDAGNQASVAICQAIMGIAGGVWAFRKYNDGSHIAVAGRSFKRLTLAGLLILVAAALSVSNALTFITAGLLNSIAGALVLMRAKSVTPSSG